MAIDTETEAIEGQEIPRLALVGVSDGRTHALLRPDQLGEFFEQHSDKTLVGHNFAFDYWVMSKALKTAPNDQDLKKVHDTMILEQLIQLTEQGSGDEDNWWKSPSLDDVAKKYVGLEVPKDNPYRLRFGEIIGKDLNEIDPGFLEYAIVDPIATHRVAVKMIEKAKKIVKDHNLPTTYGLLTETLQIKASIALADIGRRGIAVDQEALQTLEGILRGHWTGTWRLSDPIG